MGFGYKGQHGGINEGWWLSKGVGVMMVGGGGYRGYQAG
jgi:hypothetical protein